VYCSYLGRCDSTGESCECFDKLHRLSLERCLAYHNEVGQTALGEGVDYGGHDMCPPLLWGQDESISRSDKSHSDNNAKMTATIIISCVVAFFAVLFGGILVVRFVDNKKEKQSSPSIRPRSSIASESVSDSEFNMDSLYYQDNRVSVNEQFMAENAMRRLSGPVERLSQVSRGGSNYATLDEQCSEGREKVTDEENTGSGDTI
jgi:hypothetical protein